MQDIVQNYSYAVIYNYIAIASYSEYSYVCMLVYTACVYSSVMHVHTYV